MKTVCRSITKMILSEVWTFRTLTRAKYTKLYGKDSDAIVEFATRTASFKVDTFTAADIAHELSHIVYNQMNTNSAELTQHQMEEVMAEVNAKNWNHWAYWVTSVQQELMTPP